MQPPQHFIQIGEHGTFEGVAGHQKRHREVRFSTGKQVPIFSVDVVVTVRITKRKPVLIVGQTGYVKHIGVATDLAICPQQCNTSKVT